MTGYKHRYGGKKKWQVIENLAELRAREKALLRNQVTNLLYHGKIVTTEAKAKEIRKIAEGLIAMAVKEMDILKPQPLRLRLPARTKTERESKKW